MRVFSKELLQMNGGNIIYTTPGNYSFYLPRRTRGKLTIVGGGAPRTQYTSFGTPVNYAGGGGSAFRGDVILPAGYYSVSLTAGQAYWSGGDISIYIADGGDCEFRDTNIQLVKAVGGYGYQGGEVTVSSGLDIVYGTVEIESKGNNGTSTNTIDGVGGASLYGGYGKGADCRTNNYTEGYFALEF